MLKLSRLIKLFVLLLVFTFVLSGCGKKSPTTDPEIKEIYSLAVNAGFSGSYEEWLETIKGIDGTSITGVKINASGELEVTLSDNRVINCGKVKGQDGKDGQDGNDGKDGISITNVEINNAKELVVTFSNGVVKNLGVVVGKDGTPGSNGQNGVGITNITINDKGELVIYLSDGTNKNLGVIKDGTTPGETVYHTVTFKIGNDVFKEEQVEFGENITFVPVDDEEDKRFVGWFYNDDLWRFNIDVITKDIVLTAKFESQIPDSLVPIYQGMSIESIPISNLRYASLQLTAYLFNSFNDIIGDHLDIIPSEKVEYYAKKGEKFYINVHIYNPGNFEILSFTLNNYKYQSFEFKDGSNSNKLIIEVDAGEVAGLKEYTIDAIKYVEGTEIKDVRMDGEKTIKAGVKYDIVPKATLLQEEVLTTSYQSIIEIKDDTSLIDQSNGLHLFVYDGEQIILQKALTLGINNIVINNLLMGMKYEYQVIGIYDDYSGSGKKANTLIGAEFTTQDGYFIDSIKSTQDSISLTLNSADSQATFKNAKIYLNNNLIETKNTINGLTFNNLLSDNEYVIKLTYNYLNSGVIIEKVVEVKVHTLSKLVPSFSIDDISAGTRTISYLVTEDDLDHTNTKVSVKLYQGTKLVKTMSTLVDEFTNLLSNTEYRIVVEYEYDLNDGLGKKVISKETSVVTKALSVPTVEIISSKTLDSITYSVNIIDKSEILVIDDIRLYQGTSLISVLTTEEGTFTNLLPNTEYKVVVNYHYNLNDGTSDVLEKIEKVIITTKQIPSISYSTLTLTSTSITFKVSLIDPNVVGIITRIELYQGSTLVEELASLETRRFDSLQANTDYIIKITCEYDLNDGLGSRVLTKDFEVRTLKTLPVVEVLTDKTEDTISYSLLISDPDQVGSLKVVKLYKDNVLLVTNTSIDNPVFSNLLSNTEYRIVVEYEYDLNDGLGKKVISKETSVVTKALSVPTFQIVTSSTQTEINYSLTVTDLDQVGSLKVVKLYKDNVLLVTNTSIDNPVFSNLLSNTEYRIVVEYEYDLNDGLGKKVISKETSVVTKALSVPTVEIISSKTLDSITYSVNIIDKSEILVIDDIRLYQGTSLISVLTTEEGTFTNLLPNTEYKVVVNYHYNLNDGTSDVLEKIEKVIITTKQIPSISYSTLTLTSTSITFKVSLIDPNVVGIITRIELYQGSTLVEELASLETRRFDSLQANTDYIIKITCEYDLNDGLGSRVLTKDFEVRTLKTLPVVEVLTDKTEDTISYSLLISDPDQVGSLKVVKLYKDNVLLVTNTSIDNPVFSNLLSNTEYRIVVEYEYDLNDGLGKKVISKETSVVTKALSVPTFQIVTSSTQTEINYSLTVTDLDQVGSLKVVKLYKDNVLLVTNTSIDNPVFSNLLSNTEYRIVVEYEYDLNDGLGKKVISKETSVVTKALSVPTVEIISSKTLDSITYSVNIIDKSEILVIDDIRLYQGTSLISVLTTEEGTFTNLLPNTEYKVVVNYHYNLNDGTSDVLEKIEKVIITTKQIPSISYSTLTLTSTSITFKVSLIDPNVVGIITRIELYQGSTLVEELASLETRRFDSLQANTDYIIKITCEYDLNDGLGSRVLTKDFEVRTLKTLPVVEVLTDKTEDTISYSLLISDPDQVGSLKVVKLYKDNVLLVTNTSIDNPVFSNLLSNTEYRIVVEYEYDLNDGLGKKVISKETSVVTKALSVPTFQIVTSSTQTEINYSLTVTDLDQVGSLKVVKLYKDNVLLVTNTSIDNPVFSNLLSNTEYRIVVEYEYDLNDGLGKKVISKETSVVTKALSVPTVEIISSKTLDSITYSVNIIDKSEILVIDDIRLYQGTSLISVLTTEEGTFTNLLPNTEYKVVVNYHYNLNDGTSDVLEKIEKVIITTKQIPSISYSTLTLTSTSITFKVSLIDPNVVGIITRIELYQGSTLVEELASLETRRFDSLQANTDYIIKITCEYDLNDGLGSRVLTKDFEVRTLKTLPVVEVLTDKTEDTISYSLLISDPDQVGSLKVVKLYKDNVLLVTNTSIDNPVFSNLLSNTEYRIVVEYEYDLNDGRGTNVLTQSANVKTLKVKPKLELVPYMLTQTFIQFDLIVDNFDATCEVTTIGLYKDKSLVQRLQDLTIKEFYELIPYTDYEIRITYTYDLEDGKGTIASTYRYEFNTLKNEPVISYENVLSTFSSVSFTALIDDIHSSGYVKQFNLYYYDRLIKTIDAFDTTTLISQEFAGLYSNSRYKLGIVYEYDLEDNEGTRVKEEIYYFNTLQKAQPNVSIVDVIVGYDDLEFKLIKNDVDLVGLTFKSINLYDNNTLVNNFIESNLSCNGLLSSHIYSLVVIYEYDLNDNTGVKQITLSQTIKTSDFDVPTIELIDTNIRYNIIEFGVRSTDANGLYQEVQRVKLYLNGTMIKDLTTSDLYSFIDLYTDCTYDVEIFYSYDLRDGFGPQITKTRYSFKTPQKETPQVSFVDVSSTEHSVSWGYDIVDIDQVGEITKVLFNGEVIDIGTNKIDDLMSGQKYVVEVTYTYNLNDSQGYKTLVVSKNIVTQVEPIKVTNLEVLNTSTLQVGEEAHIRIYYYNPSNLFINTFLVNGIETSVITQTTNYAILKFIPDTLGGDYQVKLSSISYTLLGEELTIDIQSEFDAIITVIGNVEFVDFYVKDTYSYIVQNNDNMATFIFEVDNPLGYDILNIVVNDTNVTPIKIDDNHFEFIYYTSSSFTITAYTYGINNLDREIKISSSKQYLIYPNEVINVSTIEELQNMNDQYIYSLQKDIDLKGIAWKPYDFKGVLLGNNYTIKNLTILVENDLAGVQFTGFFSRIRGSVKDLSFDDAYISAKIKSGAVGILTGMMDKYSYVSNCSASGYVFSTSDYAGGLVGENNGTISSSYATGSVTGNGSTGGLVGGNDGTISSSYATGSVTGNVSTGGLVGYNGSGTISSSYATGIVEGSGQYTGGLVGGTGGLVGYNGSTISSSYATGDVSGYDSVGGLVGLNFGMITLSYATGIVEGSGQYTGGLVGGNDGTISSSYATGSVTGNVSTGGLVGYNGSGTISSSYATGIVEGSGQYTGGLVGINGSTISSSYATGDVSGYDSVGGLVGLNYGMITLSYATGSVTGNDYTGGLVGDNDGTISSSYATGSVTGNVATGGLVGGNNGSGTISSSYATGIVEGSGQYTGGLVGYNGSTISSCYSIQFDSYAQVLPTVEEIVDAVKIQWDHEEWDFIILNEYQCPTLKSFTQNLN